MPQHGWANKRRFEAFRAQRGVPAVVLGTGKQLGRRAADWQWPAWRNGVLRIQQRAPRSERRYIVVGGGTRLEQPRCERASAGRAKARTRGAKVSRSGSGMPQDAGPLQPVLRAFGR